MLYFQGFGGVIGETIGAKRAGGRVICNELSRQKVNDKDIKLY